MLKVEENETIPPRLIRGFILSGMAALQGLVVFAVVSTLQEWTYLERVPEATWFAFWGWQLGIHILLPLHLHHFSRKLRYILIVYCIGVFALLLFICYSALTVPVNIPSFG